MSGVNCSKWVRQSWNYSGKCSLGLYGGYPSLGVCGRACSSRVPIDPAQPAVEYPPPDAVATPISFTVEAPGGLEEWGRAAWLVAHRRPLAYEGNAAAERAWLARFGASIPCGSCRTDWARRTAGNPPDLSSPAAYARWWWSQHNDVNQSTGKPIFEWPAAVVAHGYPGAWL